MLAQELHLVGEDAAIGEDQELGAVRNVGRVDELHVRLFGSAAAFLLVARAAGRDDVHPMARPAARHREDVVAGEPEGREVAAAECADETVAVEKLAVVQWRYLVETLDRERLAANRDDRIGGGARAFPRAVAMPAVDRERFAPCFPSYTFLGVIPNSLLPGDPSVGNAVLVERQDEGKASHRRFLGRFCVLKRELG